MKRRPLSRLRPDQLGRLFSTVTDKADSAFDTPDNSAIRPEEPEARGGPSGDAPGAPSPTHVPDPAREPLGTWIGRYKLLSVLGEGGMGVVYQAEQEYPMRRQVALKIVKPGMDTNEVIARFEAERQALALLDHPSIAHIYNAGTTESGRPYFAMELVSGAPITEHCDRHKLTIEERLELFLQVCAAIQHAHQKGIIHRDLKPSNILVSMRDDQAIPKIIDFGIAKALSQLLTERTLFTEDSRLLGTPEYMSPEQAEMTARGVDTRTDIYSLGVVLYRLLAGVLPFDPKTLREGGAEHIRRVIREEDPKTPSTRLGKVSEEEATEVAQRRRTDLRTLGRKLRGDLDWITLKAMAKEPDRRYATAHALAEDIQRHLHHEPVTAGSPTMAYRLRKFVRRNRNQVIAGAGIVVLVLLGFLSVRLYRQNAANSRRLAQEQRNSVRQKAEAALSAAETYYAEGQHELALEQTGTLLELVPDQLNGCLLKARILADLGRTDEAFQILEQLEAEHPEEGVVYELLAMLYVELGNDALVTRYRTLADKYPSQTPEALVVRARTAETLDDMVSLLSEALKLDREHYLARKMRALTYEAMRDYENMERDADKMIFVQPENPSGYALRAVALRQMGRYNEAIDNHNRAIERAGDAYPDIAELYDQRRETYFRMGNYEQALADASKCVEKQPDAGKYIAFVKSPYSFRSAFEQIYVIPAAGGKPWHLGKGVLLGWSKDSKYIYYHRYQEDWFIYRKAFDNPKAEPERVIYSPCYVPAISPDEKYVAYEHRGEILITDLETRETVAAWRLPILPVYYDAAWREPMHTDYEPIPIEWSPTGRELSIGTELTGFGFWIYDLDTRTARRVLPGSVVWGRWSRDGRKMALAVGHPWWEIWEADIDPNRPTVESLGPGLSEREHCRDMIAGMEDWLAWWHETVRATLAGRVEAFCHAGLGQEKETLAGLEKWLRSLPTWPTTRPATYWEMTNRVLDRYPSADADAVLSLADKAAELAQDAWAGEVLRGMACYRVGSYEEAIAHLEQAEKLRVQSNAAPYPDQVAYTAMTLHRLGRKREAEEALDRLREMFPRETSHDDFQPLVRAEKVFAETNPSLSTVWDRMEQGYLDKALELLAATRPLTPPI